MRMPNVLRTFEHRHNRSQAAAQDYDLARAGYESVCETLDCTQAGEVERYRAAADRLGRARDRWLEAQDE